MSTPLSSEVSVGVGGQAGPASPLRKSLAASKWIILASLLSFVTVYWTTCSYLDIQADLGRWGCRMSWMSPNYVRLAGPSGSAVRGLERKYGLWLYREGGLQSDVQPRGMPVLFIPGNSGSFKQVRSIASSAAHQFYERAERSGSAIGFVEDRAASERWQELDFFAVDFNEEFSAFHPNTLRDQSLYVAHAISYILSLYPAESPASLNIILVGHSMGGIVARHAVTRSNSSSVSGIITMSTPHLVPPVTFERGMQRLYDELNSKVLSTHQTRTALSLAQPVPPVLVSICGGTADTQISSDSCALKIIQMGSGGDPQHSRGRIDNGSFAVFTTGMEGVWTGVDHQAMVWCDQVRRVVAATLLDMSAANRDRKHADPVELVDLREKLSQKARRRLLGERTVQELRGKATGMGGFSEGDAVEITLEQPTFNHVGSSHAVYIVKVPPTVKGVQVIGNMRVNGVGRAGGSKMTIHLGISKAALHGETLPLSTLRVLPSSPSASVNAGSHKAFPLQGEGVKDDDLMTFAEAVLEPANHDRELFLQLDGPARGSIALQGGAQSPSWRPIKQSKTFPDVTQSSVILRELQIRRPPGCSASASAAFSTLVEHVSPATGSTVESRMYPRVDTHIPIHSHLTAAPYISHSDHKAHQSTKTGLTVNVWQDPTDRCAVQAVSFRVKWVTSLGLLVTRYRMTILAWMIGLGSLVVCAQYQQYRRTGVFPAFLDVMGRLNGKPLMGLLSSLVVACIVQASPLFRLVHNPEDYLLGVPEWFSALLVFPVLGLSYFCLLASHFAISALSMAFRLLMARTRLLGVPRSSDDRQHFEARHLTSILALSVLVKLFFPHQFAFLAAFTVQLLNVSSCDRALHAASNRPALYHSLLLVLLWLLPAHGAVLFVWIRNLLVLVEKRPQNGMTGGTRGSPGFAENTFLTGEDHALWHVFAILIIVEACSAGKTLEISLKYQPFCYATEFSLLLFASTAFLVGPRYFYVVVETAQVFMFVQAAWYLAPSVVARFRQSAEP
ncbi:hypothetical protein NliqN6_0704 [Naganishia liquefaciens]|uniref:GPI inositol-deacylase n=1 Tax=Naganishia liquefaciens TaxID=104408 RepID=A0A8H3TNE6_9TREE|nr:hypothetical protein NliqN6_0704 [Naganishia liquefaciens]